MLDKYLLPGDTYKLYLCVGIIKGQGVPYCTLKRLHHAHAVLFARVGQIQHI